MAYLVLARKYRPQTFAEVIGQEHITDLITKAIQSDRLHHAYLFCGPRGIGKTSCARILAKSLNCTQGPTIKPCGQCPCCVEIAKGINLDVLEIDGASNRGIDEIRTLRENVKFSPGFGRYKIYIIDEVHMLTTEAFNALLKTLEEPPAHVKFIFATTSPHKIPATIISRCQRFDFKRIPVETMVTAMGKIGEKERLKIDQEALYAIAKAAQGGLRDALSILDQLSVLSEEGIGAVDVFSMLGLVETQFLFDLTAALGQKDCSLALEILEKIIDQGKDIKQLNKDLIEHLRNLMVIKIGGKTLGKLVDYPAAVKDMYLGQCGQFTLKEILKAIDTFIDAQETAIITESVRMPLEVAFAKLTYTIEPGVGAQVRSPGIVPESTPVQPVFKPKASFAFEAPAVPAVKDKKGPIDCASFKLQESEENDEILEAVTSTMDLGFATPAAPIVEQESLNIERIKRCWDMLTHAVSRERMSLATYLQEGVPLALRESQLTVGFPKEYAFHKEALEDNSNRQLIAKIFSEKLGVLVSLCFEILDDFKPQEEEGVVQHALNTFNGKIISRWHKT